MILEILDNCGATPQRSSSLFVVLGFVIWFSGLQNLLVGSAKLSTNIITCRAVQAPEQFLCE